MNQKMQVSVHEAGHYVVAQKKGLACRVGLKEQDGIWEGFNEDKSGIIALLNKKLDRKEELNESDIENIEKCLCILCAGKIAEEVYFFKEKKSFGSNYNMQSDFQDQQDYAKYCLAILKKDSPFWNQESNYEIVREILNEEYDNFKNIYLEIYSSNKKE